LASVRYLVEREAMNQLAPITADRAPALVAAAGAGRATAVTDALNASAGLGLYRPPYQRPPASF
jgi:hypothetical protein